MSLLKYEDYERRLREEDGEPKPVLDEIADAAEHLNSKSVENLCEIKGIGPKTAEKIKNNGPYESLEDWHEQAEITEKIANKVLNGLGLRSG